MSISAKLFASGERKLILVHDKQLINIHLGIMTNILQSDDNSHFFPIALYKVLMLTVEFNKHVVFNKL